MAPVTVVFVLGLITAVATGLGALPFAFVRTVSPRVRAYANAAASGLMMGACFGLMAEGSAAGRLPTIAGGGLGVLFILAFHGRLAAREPRLGSIQGAGARRVLLILVVMTVHSFAEGVAVGAAFGEGPSLALVITAAIALHNVPEGLAISAVLRPQGVSVPGCAGWSIFSSLPQPLMAVPAYLFVDAFRPALPWALGFAAGAMFLMVFVDLLPEAYEEAPKARIAVIASLAMVAMILFQRSL